MKIKFLPNKSIPQLQRLEKKETNPKAKKRLVACIQRKQGYTLKQIAENLNISLRTVSRWLKNIEVNGLGRRYDIKNKGAECKLNRKQLTQLARDLKTNPEKFGYEASMWTMPLANIHIKKKFDVDYDDHSVWLLVRRMGFRPVTSKLQKSATPEDTDAYKKNTQADKKVRMHRTASGRVSYHTWTRVKKG